MRRVLNVLLVLVALRGQAGADTFELAVGAAFRRATEIDLAKLADASGYGASNDTSPGALGLRLAAGYQFADRLELSLDGRVSVGGLAIGHIEERYFGAQDTLGGSPSLEVGAHALFPFGDPSVRWLVGPGALYHVMSAASGVGSATIRSVAAGARGAVRFRTNDIGARGAGYVELSLDAYYHQPAYVRVGSGADPQFEADWPDGHYWSFGLACVYGFSLPFGP